MLIIGIVTIITDCALAVLLMWFSIMLVMVSVSATKRG